MLSDVEFIECLHMEITLVCPSNYQLTNEDIRAIFDWKPEVEMISLGGQLTGTLDDLQPDELARISAAIDDAEAHAFHEIAFKAKTEMIERDPIVALVLACVALEGVHAEFLRKATKGAIKEKLLKDLLREQGIHTLIQVTPRLFTPQDDRPSEDLIKKCTKAIEMRNDIIHAKTSGGDYKMLRFTFKELSDAFSAIIEMYDKLLDLISYADIPAS